MAAPETNVEEFLSFFTDKHPLFNQNLSNFKALIKSEDFHLYSVVQNKRQNILLKVMCDNVLFDTELLVIRRLNAFIRGDEPNLGITLRLKSHFHFEANTNIDDAASMLSEGQDEEHFYFLFESCRSNLFQTMGIRKQKLSQTKVINDDVTDDMMSTSTIINNVIKFDPTFMWSEA